MAAKPRVPAIQKSKPPAGSPPPGKVIDLKLTANLAQNLAAAERQVKATATEF